MKKFIRKLFAIFASLVLIISVFSSAVLAASIDANPKKLPDTLDSKSDNIPSIISSEYDVDLKNQTKRVHVAISNSSCMGKFTMGGYYNEQWQRLLYGYGYPSYESTSYFTVRVENETSSVNYTNKESMMDPYVVECVHWTGEDAVSMIWRLPDDIVVKQNIQLVQNLARIEIVATNEGSSTKKIGVRYYYDTQVAWNDNAPIYIPGTGVITTQEEYVDPAFTYWKGYDHPTEPTVVSEAKISGMDATPPDRLQIDNYGSEEVWDNYVSPGTTFSDSAVLTYWDPSDVAPDQSKQVVTYYGIGEPVAIGPFNISEILVDRLDRKYCPQENVTIKVDVISIGETHEGSVKIDILDGSNVLYSSPIKTTGTVPADRTATVEFNWTVDVEACGKDLDIKASLLDSSTLALIDERTKPSMINVDPDCPECGIKPDLTVTNISWTPEDIAGDDIVTFTATVENIGEGNTSRDFHVKFEIDGSNIGYAMVSGGLDSGSSTSVTQTWTATWGHMVNVSVDENNEVEESDETNNRMSKNLPGLPLPDLIVTRLAWEPKENISAGDPVTFSATIENTGGTFSSIMSNPLKVAFLVNDEYAGCRNIVGGIRAGQPVNTTFTWSAQPGTNPVICMVADYSGIIPESNEDNNKLCDTVSLVIKSPDLTITQLTFEPTGSLHVGDIVNFTVTVDNTGEGDYSGDFYIGFDVNETFAGTLHVIDGVAAGESILSTFNWSASSCSNPVIKAKADFFNEVPESAEDNNEITGTLRASIPYADLEISDIEWNPADNIKDRDSVVFNVTVNNNGPEHAAGDFEVYLDIDGYFTRTDLISGGLAVGESTTSSFTWKATPGSDHNLTVKVDPGNTVPESDKTNNNRVQLLPLNVSLVEIFEISMEPDEITTGIGGETICEIKINNYGSASGNFDITVSGPGTDWYTLSRPSVYLSAGQEEIIDLIISVPDVCENSGTFPVQVSVTSQESAITRQGSTDLIVEPAPVVHNLLPQDGASLGSDDVTFSWNTYINATSKIFLKSEEETGYTTYTGADGQLHTVVVSNLTRDINYSYYAQSDSPCGTNTSPVRTFHIGNGIGFTQDVYEFTVERDYDQRVTIGVLNTDNEYHELLVDVPTTYDDLVLGFVGEGSKDNIIPLNPGRSKDITLAVHLQDAIKEDYEFMANLTSTKRDETLSDTALIRIHVHVPNIDYDIEKISVDEITLMQTFKLTNKGDPITDLTVLAADNLKENAYIEPVIDHYRLGEGATIEFNVIPILSSQDFQPSSSIPLVEGDISVIAAGIEKMDKVSFTIPEGKQLYKATVPGGNQLLDASGSGAGIIHRTTVKCKHCNNNPTNEVSFGVHRGIKNKIRDDPLYIKFSSPGWEVKPHDLYISINGHEVGSLINTIPEGYYKFDVDPSFLIYPERGVAKNYIELHSVHQNGGHYLISSDIEIRLNLENYETWVIASSQEEADQIAADNLPPGFYESPDNITIGEVVITPEAGDSAMLSTSLANHEVNIGRKNTIQITTDPNLEVKATFNNNDKEVILQEKEPGVYRGTWIPKNPGDANGNCVITFHAKASGNKAKKTLTVKIKNPTKLKVEILNPSGGSILTVDECYPIQVKVTKVGIAGEDCGPALNAQVHAQITNLDNEKFLYHLGGGLYSCSYTPESPSENIRIAVRAKEDNLVGFDEIFVKVKPKLKLDIDIPIREIDPYWDYSWLSRYPQICEIYYDPNDHFDERNKCLIPPIKITPRNRDALLEIRITDPDGKEIFYNTINRKKDEPWVSDKLDVAKFNEGYCKIEVKGKAFPLSTEKWDITDYDKIKIERNPYYITIKEAMNRDATENDVIIEVKPWAFLMINEDVESHLRKNRVKRSEYISIWIGTTFFILSFAATFAATASKLLSSIIGTAGYVGSTGWTIHSSDFSVDVGEGLGDVNYFYEWYEQGWNWKDTKYVRDYNRHVYGKKSILFPLKTGRTSAKEKDQWGRPTITKALSMKGDFYIADIDPVYYDTCDGFGPPWSKDSYKMKGYTKFPRFVEEPLGTELWKSLMKKFNEAIQKLEKKQDEADLKALATNLEDVSLVALADKMTCIPGEPVEIIAFILEGDTIIEGISASAKIQRPDGLIDNLPLFDDGMHNDFETNDGFYGNSYTGNDMGVYTVTTFASGTNLRGKTFNLSTILPVVWTKVTAEFNDICSDHGIDSNGDGLFDHLAVDVGINITGAGDYVLVAELTDAQAACIARAQNYTHFDVGEKTIKLSFDGVQIYRGGVDGPYNLLLTLYDLSTGYIIDYYIYDEAYKTSAYSSSDFQTPPGKLSTILSDQGTDTDGDGFYNILTVDIGINVNTSGNYSIEGFLYDTNGNFTAWADNQVPLNSGDQVIQLDFDGQAIRGHSIEGPYNLTGVILYDEAGKPIDYQAAIYTTSAYSYTDFQPLPAQFNNNYSDHGKDTDSDSEYNYLIVEAGIAVTTPGNYALQGQLYDADGNYIAWTNNMLHLDPGDHMVELDFNGVAIYQHGIDGAFSLTDLYLSDTDTNEIINVAFDAYTTSAYSYTDFETPSAQLNDMFSDYGTDLDDNGLYDHLTVEAGINITEAGNYSLEGRLADNSGNSIVYDYNYTYLDAGSQTVQLNFNGLAIRMHSMDGPYNVTDLRLCDESGETIDSRIDAHTTSAYNYTQFEGYPVDLSLLNSDIAFDPETPVDGQAVDITAAIRNTGTNDIGPVLVQFFNGDPDAGGIQIGTDQTISEIAHERTGTAQVNWTAVVGTHDIFVQVDPYNSIEETNENNNQANRQITISTSTTALPDLTLASDDIQFIPTASISSSPSGYATTGTEIMDASGTITSSWTTSPPTIDGTLENEEWADATEINITYMSGGNCRMLVMNDEENLYITFNVVDDTTNDINKQDLMQLIFDGDHDNLIAPYGTEPFYNGGTCVDLGAKIFGNETLSKAGWINMNETGAVCRLYSKLDNTTGPQVLATGFSNYRVYEYSIPFITALNISTGDTVGFNVVVRDGVGTANPDDFILHGLWPSTWNGPCNFTADGDLILASASVQKPDPSVLKATIHNIGETNAGPVVVQFYDGDPDAGGVQIGTDRTISGILHQNTKTAQVNWTAPIGTYDIFVRVDPYNSIEETNENNNQAYKSITLD